MIVLVSKNEKQDKKGTDSVVSTPKNLLIPVLLLLLKNWNAHGYELMQKLTQFGFHSIDQGNFYRILRQLEKDELVSSVWDTTSTGPAKRIYSITSAGEQYLDIWAGSLEQYQKILQQFFNMYSTFFTTAGFTAMKEDKDEQS
ncbi:poly-beta-hydroxybutyrate-responsive repressor [Bacillus benzoevorans]|uniref:Poly-beta-hydroxybutyrate-responsive repressor n=1 Tax=Bacillus benzoevorans TaxID=1456 RepID=A0A7X0LTV8_9BACI|nr:poly-beta-hydroxybutyrate-responsive repressor [Bacillus benzoevorans]